MGDNYAMEYATNAAQILNCIPFLGSKELTILLTDFIPGWGPLSWFKELAESDTTWLSRIRLGHLRYDSDF